MDEAAGGYIEVSRRERRGREGGIAECLERILPEDFPALKVGKPRRLFPCREVLTIRRYVVANPPPQRGLVEWIIVLGRAQPDPGPGITAFVDDV